MIFRSIVSPRPGRVWVGSGAECGSCWRRRPTDRPAATVAPKRPTRKESAAPPPPPPDRPAADDATGWCLNDRHTRCAVAHATTRPARAAPAARSIGSTRRREERATTHDAATTTRPARAAPAARSDRLGSGLGARGSDRTRSTRTICRPHAAAKDHVRPAAEAEGPAHERRAEAGGADGEGQVRHRRASKR